MQMAEDTRPTRPSILIVEDEQLVVLDLEETLRGMNCEVIGVASSWEEAMRAASQRKPDVALLDIRIRGRHDGIETAKMLRDKFQVPVVFLTAHADDETVMRAARAEPYGYIVKPFNPQSLRSAVEVALHKHSVETRLRESERWFSTTLGCIGDGVIACDPDERIRFLNGAGARLTGWDKNEARGRPLLEVFRAKSSGDVSSTVARAMRERTPQTIPPNTRLIPKDESGERLIEDSASPIIDDRGELLGAVLVFRDVTEERRLQEQVAMDQRLSSLGMIAASVAHEINNPLACTLANLEFSLQEMRILVRNLDDSALGEVARALSEAREASERIQKTVSNLRYFSRPQDEELALVDIRRCVEWALRLTTNEVRHAAHLVVALKPVPLVVGDPSKLGQVIVNLLTNAAQSIRGRPSSNEIRVATYQSRSSGQVVVEVSDTGAGIPGELQAKIFEPFFSTKVLDSRAGSGLGLSICRNILLAHRGTISVESQQGKGALFRVELPPAPEVAGAKEGAKAPPVSGAPGSARILVVDDEPALRRIVKRMLEPTHQVVDVGDGRSALAMLLKDRFDLVLCDLMLPDYTGVDLYEEVSVTHPEQAKRFVFMTGGAFLPRAAQFLEHVPNIRIEKPFTIEGLNEALQRALANVRG
jgi:two-component system, cell cycle sensor histidine kinase and response regulator CckA